MIIFCGNFFKNRLINYNAQGAEKSTSTGIVQGLYTSFNAALKHVLAQQVIALLKDWSLTATIYVLKKCHFYEVLMKFLPEQSN